MIASRLGLRTFSLLDGTTVAFQEWGSKISKKKILALHGWLDNSNTHTYLGPYLAERGYHVIAFDFCGHGMSSHLPRGSNYLFQKHVSHMHDIIEILNWNFGSQSETSTVPHRNHAPSHTSSAAASIPAVPPTTSMPTTSQDGYELNLVGHSMGAALSVLYASSFPEVITGKVVLIENFGQLTRPPSETSNNLRRGIQAEHKLLRANYVSQETFSPKVYASLSDAIDARLKTVSMLPGNQTMARSSAELLVRRGSKEVQVTSAILTPQVNACSVANIDQPQQPSVPVPVPVRFTHDSALLSPSLYYSSEEQVLSVIDCIRSKTLVIFGETGWPMESTNSNYATRLRVMSDKPGDLLTVIRIPGSHHLHIDPETAPLCARHVFDFLSR